jgi:hypothetical protein
LHSGVLVEEVSSPVLAVLPVLPEAAVEDPDAELDEAAPAGAPELPAAECEATPHPVSAMTEAPAAAMAIAKAGV